MTPVVSLFSVSLLTTDIHIILSPDLDQFDPRARRRSDASSSYREAGHPSQPANRVKQARQPKLVAMRPQTDATQSENVRDERTASFGERRKRGATNPLKNLADRHEDHAIMEMSWIPSTTSKDDVPSDNETQTVRSKPKGKRKGVETFGVGMERGVDTSEQGGEQGRTGRLKRRSGVRSGSRNVFRNL